MKADKKKLGYIGKKPGVSNRDSNSWYTPLKYIKSVKKVLGTINLDPFSSDFANKIVGAEQIFTEKYSAFEYKWPKVKNCFMNPPYSNGLCGKAINIFLEEFNKNTLQNGIVLVNNATDTKWFHSLAKETTALCFTDHRISFYNKDGKSQSINTRGQVFLFFGESKIKTKFLKEFKKHGLVVTKRRG